MDKAQIEGMSAGELREVAQRLAIANQAFEEREALLKEELARLTLATTAPKAPVSPPTDVSEPRAQEELRPARKDWSLQGMVAPWGGDGSVPVTEFLEGVELVARSGNWEDKDRALVVRMRLRGAAAAFLASRADLRRLDATYNEIREALILRFKDRAKPEQYLLQLSDLHQGEGEGATAFADRCRAMGQKALVEEDTPEAQGIARKHMERVVLATFLKGLRGSVGTFIRLNPPASLEEAAQKASEVEGELGSSARLFVVDHPSVAPGEYEKESPKKEEERVMACYRCGGRGHIARACATARGFPNVTGRGGSKGVTPRLIPSQRPTCFSCGKPGHYARECPSGPKNRPNPKENGPEEPRTPVRY